MTNHKRTFEAQNKDTIEKLRKLESTKQALESHLKLVTDNLAKLNAYYDTNHQVFEEKLKFLEKEAAHQEGLYQICQKHKST